MIQVSDELKVLDLLDRLRENDIDAYNRAMRVAELTVQIASRTKKSINECHLFYIGALLHEVATPVKVPQNKGFDKIFTLTHDYDKLVNCTNPQTKSITKHQDFKLLFNSIDNKYDKESVGALIGIELDKAFKRI